MLLCSRIISIGDKVRLAAQLDRARCSRLTYAPYLDFFRAQIQDAEGLPPDQIPDDVVTINSRFTVIDPQTGESICYTLVYPEPEGAYAGRVSALSAMGAAFVGARVGDEIRWPSANGRRLARIQRLLYQPESAVGLGV